MKCMDPYLCLKSLCQKMFCPSATVTVLKCSCYRFKKNTHTKLSVGATKLSMYKTLLCFNAERYKKKTFLKRCKRRKCS